MLPPNLRPIIKRIDDAIEKAASRADDRSKRAGESQQKVAVAVNSLSDELKTYQAKQAESERKKDLREKITIGSLVVTAAVTFALAYIACLQTGISDRTDRTLHDTLVAATRAYIAPGALQFNAKPTKEVDNVIILPVQNIGREPAKNVGRKEIFGVLDPVFLVPPTGKLIAEKYAEEIEKAAPGDPCKEADSLRYLGVVYPNQTTVQTAPITVPAKFMTEGVVNGTTELIVKGCFVYNTFGERRESRYCYVYWAAGPQHAQVGGFHFCTIGNDAN